MRPKLIAIENFVVSHVVLLLRLAGLVSVTSGLIGVRVWLVDLLDREDGDHLRLGFWHNPFMQFHPFDEPFLDISMLILLGCSAAVGLGGLILLVPGKWGVPLVTWQARASIVINGVVAFFIVAMMFVWEGWLPPGIHNALVLRLGAIAVDVLLWTFLTSDAVREYLRWQSHPAARAFDVIVKDDSAPLRAG